MIKIQVNYTSCKVLEKPKLTSGMVGLPCEFMFSPEWEKLNKTAVFEGSGVTKDAILTDNTVPVPHEVLKESGSVLRVGVYGTDEKGERVIPTLYTIVDIINQGADPSGDESADPSLPIWEQVLAQAGGTTIMVDGEPVTEFDANTKQDKLIPGNNINIDENGVISAEGGNGSDSGCGTTVTVKGEAVSEFNADTKQDKLKAGENITIDENNVISSSGGSGGTTVKVNGEAVAEFDADTKVDKIDNSGGVIKAYCNSNNKTLLLGTDNSTPLVGYIPRFTSRKTLVTDTATKDFDCVNLKQFNDGILHKHNITLTYGNEPLVFTVYFSYYDHSQEVATREKIIELWQNNTILAKCNEQIAVMYLEEGWKYYLKFITTTDIADIYYEDLNNLEYFEITDVVE